MLWLAEYGLDSNKWDLSLNIIITTRALLMMAPEYLLFVIDRWAVYSNEGGSPAAIGSPDDV